VVSTRAILHEDNGVALVHVAVGVAEVAAAAAEGATPGAGSGVLVLLNHLHSQSIFVWRV
jgi:hypothetical protein